MCSLIVLLNFMILSLNSASAEVFSAIYHFEELFQNEKIIIEEIKRLSQNLKQIAEDLDNYSDRLSQDHFLASNEKTDNYFSNPLNCFSLIKRCTHNLKSFETKILYDVALFSERTGKFVTNFDLLGVVDGIFRLQKFYKIRTEDLADGIIGGKKIAKSLTAEDLHLIGLKAHEQGEEYFAQEYLKLSLEKFPNSEDIDEISLTLAKSFKNTGDYENAILLLDKVLENDHSKISAYLMLNELESFRGKNKISDLRSPFNETFEKNGEFHNEKEEFIFRRACRGEMKKSEKETSKLFCRISSTNFFTKIAPFKIEEINFDPKILLFHDVLSDSEVEHLKKISIPQLNRALVISGNVEISNIRISQVAWHGDQDKVVRKISRRISDLTGLTMDSSENLQIQNYGIGGQYNLHFDHRLKNQKEFDIPGGNRLATVLFYMSDVAIGGATVFPYLNVYVPAVKNSAIFWYNLKSSGISEHRSRHGGCPVLLGSKWVANKWIHELGQPLICPVDSFEEEIEVSEYFKEFF